jgi:predicted anti-sigma-YlaC factor YlaD
MRHVANLDLIDLASGRLPDEARIRTHLEACAACRARYEHVRDVHDALSAWTVEGSADLWPGIERQLERPALRRSAPTWAAALMRAAAAILVGVGLGHGAARIWTPDYGAPASVDEGLNSSLALYALDGQSPTGLPLLLGDAENLIGPEDMP